MNRLVTNGKESESFKIFKLQLYLPCAGSKILDALVYSTSNEHTDASKFEKWIPTFSMYKYNPQIDHFSLGLSWWEARMDKKWTSTYKDVENIINLLNKCLTDTNNLVHKPCVELVMSYVIVPRIDLNVLHNLVLLSRSNSDVHHLSKKEMFNLFGTLAVNELVIEYGYANYVHTVVFRNRVSGRRFANTAGWREWVSCVYGRDCPNISGFCKSWHPKKHVGCPRVPVAPYVPLPGEPY